MIILPLVPVKTAGFGSLMNAAQGPVFGALTVAQGVDTAKSLMKSPKKIRQDAGVPEPAPKVGMVQPALPGNVTARRVDRVLAKSTAAGNNSLGAGGMGNTPEGKEAGFFGALRHGLDSAAPVTRGLGDVGWGLAGLGTLGLTGHQLATQNTRDQRDAELHAAALDRMKSAPILEASANEADKPSMPAYVGMSPLQSMKSASLSFKI